MPFMISILAYRLCMASIVTFTTNTIFQIYLYILSCLPLSTATSTEASPVLLLKQALIIPWPYPKQRQSNSKNWPMPYKPQYSSNEKRPEIFQVSFHLSFRSKQLRHSYSFAGSVSRQLHVKVFQ